MRDDQITLAGNLAADPVLRFTKTTGRAVTNLRVARNYPRDEQGNQRPAEFFDIEVWQELAENTSGLRKGDRVVIIGRYKADSWTSEDGTVHHTFRIVADELALSMRWNPAQSIRPDSTPKQQVLSLPEELF